MTEPLTEELLAQLLDASSPTAFIESNAINDRSLPDYLHDLLEEKGIKRSEAIRNAGLNDTFGYQIFMGSRRPSRNKLLQLAFSMRLTLQETNRMLQAGGANELYCKTRRDAIIIFALDRGYCLQKTNEALYEFGEDTIC